MDKPKRIAVTGASGLVGRALCRSLAASGHDVVRLVRRREDAADDAIYWSPDRGELQTADLEGVDGVVHLAGYSVAAHRWNAERRRRIRDSRVKGTRLLAEAAAGLTRRPRVFVSASAVGIYGPAAHEPVDEGGPTGEGFLAEVCRAWEAAAGPAREAGIRLCHLRIGLVLAQEGGVLGKMLPLFRGGMGGRLGDGSQWMSWITREDLVRIIETALVDDRYRGPVNAVTPQPVSNAEFTRVLARTLGRPGVVPAPATALRWALGRQMSEETVLASQRVRPAALENFGFEWQQPELGPALAHLLHR